MKLTAKYQRKESSLIDKYKYSTYHKVYFRGGINIDLNFIMCEDKIVIPYILHNDVLHWYHTYLIHPGMDTTEGMTCQHFYYIGIRNAVWRKVTNCDTFQHTKRSKIKYGKFPAKKFEKISWKKLCVDLIGSYVIRIKGKK